MLSKGGRTVFTTDCDRLEELFIAMASLCLEKLDGNNVGEDAAGKIFPILHLSEKLLSKIGILPGFRDVGPGVRVCAITRIFSVAILGAYG